jgi:hypothetical protein
MKVVIFGSRRIDRLEEVEKAVEASGVLARITEIVSGCALGVDTSAIAYAEKHHLPVKLFPAKWAEHGRQAGALRNMEMAAYADFGVAVWDGLSPGTEHMIGLMEGRVFVWRTDEADRLIITEPAQVAVLKALYENGGPKAGELDWDFSRPGQASLPDREAGARQGRLNYISLWPFWPWPWPEGLLKALTEADFDIHLRVAGCHGPDPDGEYEDEEDQAEEEEETGSSP